MVEKKNKTLFLALLGSIVLLLLVGGVTYAFYNYTKTGGANILKTGSMNFYSNYEEGTLQNAYPIPEYLVDTDTDNVMEIEVTVSGKTTHPNGIEYAISLTDINASVDNIDVPLSVKSTASGLGDSDYNYFENHGGNSKIYSVSDGIVKNDEYFFIGYIPGSDTNTNGTVSIKVYLDADAIGVSDTYDGMESKINGTTNSWADGKIILTETQWNTLRTNGITFKIKVEAYNGAWVKGSLYNIIYQKQKTGGVSYIASYEDIREDGFITQDYFTDESFEKKEVLYFTGSSAALNSNVLFAGYCWNIMRTTDNGGVKLIYNGLAENDKCGTTRAANIGMKYDSIVTDFDLSNEVLYSDSFSYDTSSQTFTLLNPTSAIYSSSTASSLMSKWTCNSNEATCETLYYVGHMTSNTTATVAAYNIRTLDSYGQLARTVFNVSDDVISYVGYMYNAIYHPQTGLKEGTFWSYVKWNAQDEVYELADDGTTSETIGKKYHYICDDADCTKVRYYYWHQTDGDVYYYIVLENGTKDPLAEMIGYKANDGDVVNVYDSVVKSVVDNWYRNELLSYSNYIDKDTIYCNDRSIYSSNSNIRSWDRSASLETNSSDIIYFNQKGSKYRNNLYCPSETDRFSASVNNTKAHLNYPIGLVTETERSLMDGLYAARHDYWWTMTPGYTTAAQSFIHNIRPNNGTESYGKPSNTNTIRPVITLKADTKISSGIGTYESPYVIAE